IEVPEHAVQDPDIGRTGSRDRIHLAQRGQSDRAKVRSVVMKEESVVVVTSSSHPYIPRTAAKDRPHVGGPANPSVDERPALAVVMNDGRVVAGCPDIRGPASPDVVQHPAARRTRAAGGAEVLELLLVEALAIPVRDHGTDQPQILGPTPPEALSELMGR